jgi:hypothetical protein
MSDNQSEKYLYAVWHHPIVVIATGSKAHRLEVICTRQRNQRLAVYLYSAQQNKAWKISVDIPKARLGKFDFVLRSNKLEAIRKTLAAARILRDTGRTVHSAARGALPICRLTPMCIRRQFCNNPTPHRLLETIRKIKQVLRHSLSSYRDHIRRETSLYRHR